MATFKNPPSPEDILLNVPVKIPVKHLQEAISVQQALFELGCGWHNGSGLMQELFERPNVMAYGVSRNGRLSFFVKGYDEQFYAESNSVELAPETLLRKNLDTLKSALASRWERIRLRQQAVSLVREVSQLDPESLSDDQITLLKCVLSSPPQR